MVLAQHVESVWIWLGHVESPAGHENNNFVLFKPKSTFFSLCCFVYLESETLLSLTLFDAVTVFLKYLVPLLI